MAFVMTKDGKVRPAQVSDLKEVAERDERIKQLEQQCAVLAAEIDRQQAEINRKQLLCDTAIDVYYGRRHKHDLGLVIHAYEAARESAR